MKKQIHKDKNQILFEKEQKKLAEIRMAFINDKYMPLMEEITENLQEAQILAETIKSLIDKASQKKLMEMKLWELGIKEEINKSKYPERFKKHIKILEVLDNQTISDSIRLCDGLFDAVNNKILDDLKMKKISDFKNENRN